MPSPKPFRIYLAGPDVFLRNPVEVGRRKKDLCAAYGFEGVYPFDVEPDGGDFSKYDRGVQIGRNNENLIRSCDLILANITPFRGPSADVGTAYEMGFGRALGLVVFAYTNVSPPFTLRTIHWLGQSVQAGAEKRDGNDMEVEDFDMVDNLMLESCIVSSGGSLTTYNAPHAEIFTALAGFETALQKIKAAYPLGKLPE